MKLVPSKFQNEILEFIKQGKTPTQTAKLLNLNPVSVSSFYLKQGIKTKPDKGNVRYFQNIDTHQKAYFLGFIAADGAIVKNTLTITIHFKDKCILEKLKEEIGNSHKLQEIHTKMSFDHSRIVNHVRFCLTDKSLILDLNNLGIYPKKSMTIGNIINNIPYEFRDSFIIGYFDGDGSVTLPKGNTKISKKGLQNYPSYRTVVNFRGTLEFLQGIATHLNVNTKITFDKTHSLYIRRKEYILRFFSCYKNLNFYLLRKHDKFLERINHESYRKLI